MSALLYGCTTKRKSRMGTTQECYLLLWTKPEGDSSQTGSCTATVPYLTKYPDKIKKKQVGHFWEIQDKLIHSVFLWTPTHRHTNTGRQVKTYIHQLCVARSDGQKGRIAGEWRDFLQSARLDAVTISLIGFVAYQMQYNLESAQYLW